MSQCRLLSKYSLGGVFYVVVLFFSFSNWFEFYVQLIKPSKAKDSKNLAFLKNFKPMEDLNHSIKINKLNFKPGFSNIEERELPLMSNVGACYNLVHGKIQHKHDCH